MAQLDDLISVNITTYNRCHLLPRAIKSVLNQTHKNLELIVVDDGSADETKKVIKEFEKKHKRIKGYFHDRNRGNAVARNTALSKSKGEYIAFLDDDDEWIDKNKLNKQLRILKESRNKNLALVSSKIKMVDADGKVSLPRIRIPGNLVRHMLAGNSLIFSSSVMVKRRAVEAIGGFNEKMPRGIDSEFFRGLIVTHGFDIKITPERMVRIYEHGGVRYTPINSLTAVYRSIWAQVYLIIKYLKWWPKYPWSLWVRLLVIASNIAYVPRIITRKLINK